jgi:hypothetical protein
MNSKILISTKGARFCIIILICLGIYAYITHKNAHSIPTTKTINYPHKSSIKNRLKIDIQPLSLSYTHPSTFKITLESTQAPVLAQLNLLKSALLTDEKNIPYQPTHWEVISQDDYHQEGLLTFPPIPKTNKLISMTIFEYEDRTFTWEMAP